MRRDLHATLLDRVERLDLRSYLRDDDQLDLHRIFAAHPHLHAGCSGDLSGFLDDVLTGTGNDLLRIRGGMNQLTDRLADRLSRPVLLNRQITGIDTGPDGVLIQVRQDGRPVTHRKATHRNKLITTAALGDQRLYDFVADNPSVEFHPVDYTNDATVIAREPNMYSVNATLEVDFLGQCASESLGSQYLSSSGGQPDFARGAVMSENGHAYVVLHSATADDTVSRIVPSCSPAPPSPPTRTSSTTS